MNILIYELSQGRKIPVYYRRLKNTFLKNDMGPMYLSYRANRIWDWNTETDSVQYLKHRQDGPTASVDRKEFFLIQLKAKEWRHETA